MATKLGVILADFRTSLATKLSIGAATCSIQSATDDDSVALPTGKYYLTIDGDNSQKEHIYCTLTGTSLTDIKSVSRQGVQTANAVREHRVGASVVITDFAHILELNNLLSGTTDLNGAEPLAYDTDPDLTGNNKKLATVKLVEDTAMAGGADASTTVKGITKLSVAPASATEPIAVGTNDNRVSPVNLSTLTAGKIDALAGTSGTPSSTNKYVTNDDTATAATADKLARRLAGGNITVVTESAGNNSTNAASTAYVDAAIVVLAFKNGTTTKNAADASTTQNIAHGLGKIPKKVKITARYSPADSTPSPQLYAETAYNGTTQSSISYYYTSTSYTMATTFTLNVNGTNGTQTGVITFDATNIIITWTKTNSPTGTYYLLWEVIG